MTDPYAALRQCVEALELHNEYPGSIWPFQVKATRNAALTAARAALERQQLSYEREREIDQDEIERHKPLIELWRRTAQRCVTAWTVVRGGVWDPNGLMDEHVDALRKALGPNEKIQGDGQA